MGTSRPGDEPGQSAAAGFGIATRAQAGREIILDAGMPTEERAPGGQDAALSHHQAGQLQHGISFPIGIWIVMTAILEDTMIYDAA